MKPARPDGLPKGSSRLRVGRRSIPGQIYLITTSTFQREPIFLNREAAAIVLEGLHHLEGQGRLELEAAVVMPDHLHVVTGLVTGTLGQAMQSLKGYAARAINVLLNRHGPVWNSQYHDHAVRKDEVLSEVIRYCLENPVRAGLVRELHEYPHWYCRYKI